MNLTNLRQSVKDRLPPRILQLRTVAEEAWDEARFRIWRLTAPRAIRIDRPIFMIGSPRSGTTVSVKILGKHPQLANWSEAGKFWDPDGYDDAEADHAWGAERATAEEIERLHQRFEYARHIRGDKPRFMNKHPRMSVRLDYLERAFPDAFYIHVIRDGRAVASSMVKRLTRHPDRPQHVLGQFVRPPDWRALRRDNQLEEGILVWREIVRHILARKPRLAGRYVELRYEDICERPREVLREVLRTVELDHDDGLLAALVPAPLESRNYKVGKVAPADLAMMNREAGDLLAELGYPV